MAYDFFNEWSVIYRKSEDVLFLTLRQIVPEDDETDGMEPFENSVRRIVMEKKQAADLSHAVLDAVGEGVPRDNDSRLTPRHVTHEASLRECTTCPGCKNVIDEWTDFAGQKVNARVAYCKFCGQALLWD